jgi:WD40 repeat protein
MLMLSGHCGKIKSLAYSPDSRLLVGGGARGGHVRVWSIPAGKTEHDFEVASGAVHVVAFSPTGGRVIVGGERTILSCWNPPDCDWWLEGKGTCAALAFPPDGRSLIVGCYFVPENDRESGCEIWQRFPSDRRCILWRDEARHVWSLRCSPDGLRLAAGQDRAVKVWDFAEKRHTFVKGFRSTVCALEYLPDGKTLAALVGTSVILLDAMDGRVVRTLEGHADRVHGLAQLPGGRFLASASGDGTVRFWLAESGEQVAVLDWKIGPLSSLAVAPDGMTAAVGGKDGRVVVWDLDEL